jgi:hypothetical protein
MAPITGALRENEADTTFSKENQCPVLAEASERELNQTKGYVV